MVMGFVGGKLMLNDNNQRLTANLDIGEGILNFEMISL